MIINAGKEAIEANDIITPITLIVSNAVLLEWSFSTPALAGTEFTMPIMAMVTTTRDLSYSSLPLSWKILERGDNPIIQVVYGGRPNAPIVLEGRIKGQPSIKQVA
jgi:hypothetical protein